MISLILVVAAMALAFVSGIIFLIGRLISEIIDNLFY